MQEASADERASQPATPGSPPAASEASQKLPEAGQNPLSGLNSSTFQLSFEGPDGPFDRSNSEFAYQPIVPIGLTRQLTLIATFGLPFKGIPDLSNASHTEWGFGDLNPQVFLSIQVGEFFVGPGATLSMPTASNAVAGDGKWELGPALGVIWFHIPIVAGFVATQRFSIAGDEARPNVTKFNLQPLAFFNLPQGTFLMTAPLILQDWLHYRWIVPIGAGVGKLVHLGTQAANINVQGYWDAGAPSVGPGWTVRLQLQLLFPELGKPAP